MTVISLYRWPADKGRIEDDVQACGESTEDFREQITENHHNAWLVVVVHKGPASEIDFDEFFYPSSDDTTQDPMNAQAVWLEQVLKDTPTRSEVAFYLHHIWPGGKLHYGDHLLDMPAEQPMPDNFLSLMPYESPT